MKTEIRRHPGPHAIHATAVVPVLVALALAALSACDRPQPAPVPVVEATIAGVQEAIVSGRTTCRMVVQAYLDRIVAYDDRINAITVVNPAALDRADELDAALAAGDEPGPLFCVPMLVKDNFDTHDMVTTAGSIALAGSIPPDDAFMVRRIREAGAIVVAKTNMAEWAFSARQSVSSSFDTTRNAYALDRVPAGSSGGTASGVAASFGLIGLGSDTGNSIRGPSSRLALVGIRSTIGLTSRDGVVPLSFDRDIAGPMGRTVEDVARVFNVVAGHDPADPYTEAGRGRQGRRLHQLPRRGRPAGRAHRGAPRTRRHGRRGLGRRRGLRGCAQPNSQNSAPKSLIRSTSTCRPSWTARTCSAAAFATTCTST